MIRAIALDDEPPALQVVSAFCKRIEDVTLLHAFTKTEEAMQFLHTNDVDLLFLDINMPSVNGVDFYKQLKKSVMVVFTTAYTEYAVDAFNVHAIDYLLKPFTFDRFLIAVEKVRQYGKLQNNDIPEPRHLILRIDYKLVKFDIDQILFIEGLDDYLKIYHVHQKPTIVRLTLKAILEKLPSDFIRVHRSYIIPLKRIESVRNKLIRIGDEEIPIGISYEEAFKSKFNSKL